ncbi:MAG: hypothetical protein AB8G22_04780 [Saprospiraceae bacterium]
MHPTSNIQHPISIEPVRTKAERKRFIDFPHDLYAGDTSYVPELYLDQSDVLSEKKNPFFQHSKMELFLARKDDKIVGRIAAIRNNNYIKVSGRNVGFFGFFEVIEDYDVCTKLLDAAKAWIDKENLKGMIGPANPSLNDTAGLLIDGFDEPPVVKLTYNKAYYQDFLERYGLKKGMDMYSYRIKAETVSKKSLALAARLEERLKSRGVTIRQVNMKRFKEEARSIREIYNGAWDSNWGFVPATLEEFDHLAEGLKLVIDKKYVYVAEKEGKPIGFVVALPDMNQVLINVKRGRLLPFGIFKILFQRKKINRIRIILLGVIDEYRRLGIEAIFYAKIIKNGIENGMQTGDASWILENNAMMRKGLENLNAEVDKTYRMYQMEW